MKKRNSFLFMLSLTIFATSTSYGAPKKKNKRYFTSISIPSFSSLNPFGGSEQKEVVLNSDQSQKPRKKKKQKSGMSAKLSTKLSGMGSTIMGAPSAMMHSRIAKTLFAVGPNSIKYVSSKKGKQQIKSALKYGIPVAALAVCGSRVKYLADRQQQSLQELRNQLPQQGQQMGHQQLANEIGQLIQNNAAAIGQVQISVNNASTTDQVHNLNDRVDQLRQDVKRANNQLNKFEHGLNNIQRRVNQSATIGQFGEFRTALTQVNNNLANEVRNAFKLSGKQKNGFNSGTVENEFKRALGSGEEVCWSGESIIVQNAINGKIWHLPNKVHFDRVVKWHADDGIYYCAKFDIEDEALVGENSRFRTAPPLLEQWADKKSLIKKDLASGFGVDQSKVIVVGRDTAEDRWL